MDAQQELYSALLMALKTKFKDTGIGVYDTFLPPDGTPYPFVYLGDSQTVDDYGNKSFIGGHVYQTVHVWHDDPKKRGTQSRIMAEIKDIARAIHDTKSYHWTIRNIWKRSVFLRKLQKEESLLSQEPVPIIQPMR